MIGTPSERNLILSLILDKHTLATATKIVTGNDFTDLRLGVIYEQVVAMLSRGEPVDTVVVQGRFSQWGVQNLDMELYAWDSAAALPHAVKDYADQVRRDSLKRAATNIQQTMGAELLSGADPFSVVSENLTRLNGLIDNRSTGILEPHTLEQILAGSDDYEWLIPGLLERQDRIIITGPEGSGKTTLCRQIVVLSAAGINPITFVPMPPINVLVIDAENTERQWRRAVRYTTREAARLGVVNPAPIVNVVAGHRIDITKGPHLAEIHRLVDRFKPDLLYIGPLYKMVPKAINSDDDAAPLIVALDSLRDRGLTLLMEAHAGKSTGASGERDLRPRGSAALLGWPEFGFGMQPDTDVPGKMHLVRWRGDRDDNRSWPVALYRGMQGQNWPWEAY